MIQKINNKLKQLLKSNKRILKTRVNRILGTSDTQRWQSQNSLFHDWDERTAILAKYIPKNSVVFEFGAARLSLKGMLPEGCTYLHSDIVARATDTYVVDLNKQLPEIPKVDVVVFSGVQEYLIKVPQLLEYLSPKTTLILWSYATINAYPDAKMRRKHGWISDHALEDFELWAKKCNFQTEILGQWRQQHLFKWQKIN